MHRLRFYRPATAGGARPTRTFRPEPETRGKSEAVEGAAGFGGDPNQLANAAPLVGARGDTAPLRSAIPVSPENESTGLRNASGNAEGSRGVKFPRPSFKKTATGSSVRELVTTTSSR